MRHATKTVTIYRKTWDPAAAVDVYNGAVFCGVSFYGNISANQSTDGLVSSNGATMRIPIAYCVTGFVPKSGDLVCEGELNTEGMQPSELDALCPCVYTVVGVTCNDSGKEPHLKVMLK